MGINSAVKLTTIRLMTPKALEMHDNAAGSWELNWRETFLPVSRGKSEMNFPQKKDEHENSSGRICTRDRAHNEWMETYFWWATFWWPSGVVWCQVAWSIHRTMAIYDAKPVNSSVDRHFFSICQVRPATKSTWNQISVAEMNLAADEHLSTRRSGHTSN